MAVATRAAAEAQVRLAGVAAWAVAEARAGAVRVAERAVRAAERARGRCPAVGGRWERRRLRTLDLGLAVAKAAAERAGATRGPHTAEAEHRSQRSRSQWYTQRTLRRHHRHHIRHRGGTRTARYIARG